MPLSCSKDSCVFPSYSEWKPRSYCGLQSPVWSGLDISLTLPQSHWHPMKHHILASEIFLLPEILSLISVCFFYFLQEFTLQDFTFYTRSTLVASLFSGLRYFQPPFLVLLFPVVFTRIKCGLHCNYYHCCCCYFPHSHLEANFIKIELFMFCL